MTPALGFTTVLQGQFHNGGTAPLTPFFGSQPDLVQGVSNQQACGARLVRHVCAVTPTLLGITVDARAVDQTGIRKYFPEPEDRIVVLEGDRPSLPTANVKLLSEEQLQAPSVDKFVFVFHGKERLGWLASPDDDMIWPAQFVYAQHLDTAAADWRATFKMRSETDDDFSEKSSSHEVHRKSKPRYRVPIGPARDRKRFMPTRLAIRPILL